MYNSRHFNNKFRVLGKIGYFDVCPIGIVYDKTGYRLWSDIYDGRVPMGFDTRTIKFLIEGSKVTVMFKGANISQFPLTAIRANTLFNMYDFYLDGRPCERLSRIG